MEVSMVELLVTQFPTFAGLVILSFALWRLYNGALVDLRQRVTFLEELVIKLLDDDDQRQAITQLLRRDR